MAEISWQRPIGARGTTAVSERLAEARARFLDWEDLLTLAIALLATVSIAATLEAGGWSDHMPAITLVSVLALPAAMVLARSRLSMFAAWPLGVLGGAFVLFWQTLEMVGPGTLPDRLDSIYWRFNDWFHLAFTGGVNNDPLPFNTLILALTWLGVFFFGWSLFRWHNAWPGLIPGGIALFLDLTFVGDSLTGASVLYILFGFLLLMRANLNSRIARWRAEGTAYPQFISVTFLNYSVWALLALIAAGWIAPTGPFTTPAPVQSLVSGVEDLTTGIVRLAGPLTVKKVVPVHNYTAVLPFQGSVKLGDRQLLAVKPEGAQLHGPVLLRGASYEQYSSGGWQAGQRQTESLPSQVEQQLKNELTSQRASGLIVPLKVQVLAQSVVGSVLFAPGQVISTDHQITVQLPSGSLQSMTPYDLGIKPDSQSLDQKVLAEHLAASGLIGFDIQRDVYGRPQFIDVFDTTQQPVPDAVVLNPASRIDKGESYNVTGFIPTYTADELRAAGVNYPSWVSDQYLQLPGSVTARTKALARQVAGALSTPYDQAKAIEDYLRSYPVDYQVGATPPGKDTVDYFLFQARRGYFDYHASAMVVMLRALGVPSRLGVGFVIDDNDRAGNGTYTVRDKNSYAWAEVYFPGHGWVPFNPSPDRPANLTPTGRGASGATPQSPSLDAFKNLPVGADPKIFEGTEKAPATAGYGSAGSGSGGGVPWTLIGIVSFIAALVVAARFGWQRSVAGLPYPQQMWEKTVRLASWAGYGPEPGQTPSDYVRRLEKAFRGVRELPLLALVYNRSRFGRRDVAPSERERLEEMWPHLRGAIAGAIVRRLTHRGRR